MFSYCETKLQTNVSVTWTTDEKGQLKWWRSSPIKSLAELVCENMRVAWALNKVSAMKIQWIRLAHTRLQHAQRIDHLLLALAIATLWCHELGEFVLQQGEPARCSVDPAHERTLSLFQLGLRWLKRFLATGLLVLPNFLARLSNLKLKPVLIPTALNSNV